MISHNVIFQNKLVSITIVLSPRCTGTHIKQRCAYTKNKQISSHFFPIQRTLFNDFSNENFKVYKHLFCLGFTHVFFTVLYCQEV